MATEVFRPTPGRQRAFTLVEVLAAMLFMAIVLPAIIQGITVANRVGAAGERQREAAEIASNLLTELAATKEWNSGRQSGESVKGSRIYAWSLETKNWAEDANMTLLSLAVQYEVQGNTQEFVMETLVDGSAQ